MRYLSLHLGVIKDNFFPPLYQLEAKIHCGKHKKTPVIMNVDEF